MDNRSLLCSKIENYILSALEREFLEAEIKIELADVPVTEEDIWSYEGVFSNLDDNELWIELHEMNKQHNISDELLFERYIDELVDLCLEDESKPDIIQKIRIYHVKPLSPTKWMDKLEMAQIKDPTVVVDDSKWESEIKPMMESVIKTLDVITKRDQEGDYRKSRQEVLERFPLLRGKALELFVTAEVFYKKFENEDALDYAPVLLEYCRAVETALWKYIEASDIYRKQGEESQKFKDQGQTFGAAVFAIKEPKDGPLRVFYRDLSRLHRFRNDSAHTTVAKEPDVRMEREKLWKSELLNVLSKINE